MGGKESEQEPRRGAGVAEIEHILGLDEGADAAARCVPHAILRALDLSPKRTHRRRGPQDVLPFEQAMDPALAQRNAAQHQRAMGDRLVARNADAAGERARWAGDQRTRQGVGRHPEDLWPKMKALA
jgi:hypothetical protein